MNKDQIKGTFDQLKGKIKMTWGRLSDDDVMLAEGQRDQFFAKIQQVYGITKEEAQKRFGELEKACHSSSDKAAYARVLRTLAIPT